MSERPNQNSLCLTFDTDWAPCWMIKKVAGILIDHNVKTTWFLTNAGSGLDLLREHEERFELGMHPNCLPGSTHGSTEVEVMSHMRELLPEARSIRTHGLYQSSAFLEQCAKRFDVEIDASILLPMHEGLRPVALYYDHCKLIRLPVFWEDDIAMKSPSKMSSDSFICIPGMKILNFHPVHILLNSFDDRTYTRLKAKLPVTQWTPDLISENRFNGFGTGSFFIEMVRHMQGKGVFLSELANWWEKECELR